MTETSLPLVSVVIPTFNAGSGLRRAVDSVLAQTHVRVEVIVVDDGSTDGSPEELANSVPHTRILALPGNSGSPAIPRNVGSRAASGDWIAFLDSDDHWYPEKLHVQLQAMESRSASVAIGSNAFRADQGGSALGKYFDNMPGQVGLLDLVQTNWIITSSLLVRRKVLMRCLPFPTVDERAFEDLAVWLRLASLGSILLTDRPLVCYEDKTHGSFKSTYGNPEQALSRTLRIHRQWCRSERMIRQWLMSLAFSGAFARRARMKVKRILTPNQPF